MSALFIFDLEGTTGIYSGGGTLHINNIIKIRSGLREALSSIVDEGFEYAIATRAPRGFVDEIVRNSEERGLYWNGVIYARDDVQLPERQLVPYKDLSKIYADHGLSNAAKEAVILGDFLRFHDNSPYTIDDYMNFDFETDSDVLTQNHALNDHPFPQRWEETPVYVVLPQPWTTFSSKWERVSLSMDYVIKFLQRMFVAGEGDFSQGFELMKKKSGPNQFVETDSLALQVLGMPYTQRYIVMKGEYEDWKPLEVLM